MKGARPLFSALLLASSVIACSRGSSEGQGAPSASASSAPSAVATAPSVEAPMDAAPPVEPNKHYARVLHAGDSMVGGGLAYALGPRFRADGAKYFRDVEESESLRQFAASKQIPDLIKKHDPDLVILSLGANDAYGPDPDKELGPFIEKIAKQVGGVDCIWIGPPTFKHLNHALIDALAAHVAPCRFFDSSHIEMHRKPDGIHPDEKGGVVWGEALWAFLYPGEAWDAGAGWLK